MLVMTDGMQAIFVLCADVTPQGLENAMRLQERTVVLRSRDYRMKTGRKAELKNPHLRM